jgi:hypothetical protein
VTKTRWSEKRLVRLFARYNRTYWRGRLPRYRVIPTILDKAMGQCDWRKLIIQIDPDQHRSERDVRYSYLNATIGSTRVARRAGK